MCKKTSSYAKMHIQKTHQVNRSLYAKRFHFGISLALSSNTKDSDSFIGIGIEIFLWIYKLDKIYPQMVAGFQKHNRTSL